METTSNTTDRKEEFGSPRTITPDIEINYETKRPDQQDSGGKASYSQALRQNLEKDMQLESDTESSDS